MARTLLPQAGDDRYGPEVVGLEKHSWQQEQLGKLEQLEHQDQFGQLQQNLSRSEETGRCVLCFLDFFLQYRYQAKDNVMRFQFFISFPEVCFYLIHLFFGLSRA
jgi:hypothetical protein